MTTRPILVGVLSVKVASSITASVPVLIISRAVSICCGRRTFEHLSEYTYKESAECEVFTPSWRHIFQGFVFRKTAR
jgi:hypothetical protein